MLVSSCLNQKHPDIAIIAIMKDKVNTYRISISATCSWVSAPNNSTTKIAADSGSLGRNPGKLIKRK
ncbi:hypothetical protein GCM10007414_31650 [Agarivorans gilvus]|uniref:Uncharacterized protein n=1 Tax=Agarivorans gilvus TaxID=680279 RepID=A0ABQ1I4P1_9ALTE|nr:hypothetical protein GCM10007414_31650 [Agarivorans gilvus]